MAQAEWYGRFGAVALVGALFGVGCGHYNESEGVPKVGDMTDEGGKVTHVTPTTQCITVTVENPPAWQCTQEEKDLARGVSAPPVPTVVAPPPMSPGFADVSLEQTDCEGLAELRRPVLKRSYLSQLENDHKSPTLELLMRVCDAIGVKASTLVAVQIA